MAKRTLEQDREIERDPLNPDARLKQKTLGVDGSPQATASKEQALKANIPCPAVTDSLEDGKPSTLAAKKQELQIRIARGGDPEAIVEARKLGLDVAPKG